MVSVRLLGYVLCCQPQWAANGLVWSCEAAVRAPVCVRVAVGLPLRQLLCWHHVRNKAIDLGATSSDGDAVTLHDSLLWTNSLSEMSFRS